MPLNSWKWEAQCIFAQFMHYIWTHSDRRVTVTLLQLPFLSINIMFWTEIQVNSTRNPRRNAKKSTLTKLFTKTIALDSKGHFQLAVDMIVICVLSALNHNALRFQLTPFEVSFIQCNGQNIVLFSGNCPLFKYRPGMNQKKEHFASLKIFVSFSSICPLQMTYCTLSFQICQIAWYFE